MGLDYYYTGRMELKGKNESIVNQVSLDINAFSDSQLYQDLKGAPESHCSWYFENVNGKMRLYCGCDKFYRSYEWLEYLDKHFIRNNGLYLEGYFYEMQCEENVSLIIASENGLKRIEVDFWDFEPEDPEQFEEDLELFDDFGKKRNSNLKKYMAAKDKIDNYLREIFKLDAVEILDVYGIYIDIGNYFEDEHSDTYGKKQFKIVKEDGSSFKIKDDDSYLTFGKEFDPISDIIIVMDD